MLRALDAEGCKYLSATTIAGEMGLHRELSVHKICSKLIHPTAYSILFAEAQNQLKRDMLFLFGGDYLANMLDDLVTLHEHLVSGRKSEPS